MNVSTRTNVGTQRPIADLEYHRTLRPVTRWWRSLVGIVAAGAAYLILSIALTSVAILLDPGSFALGQPISERPVTPMLLLAVNLAPALMIPVVIGLERLLFGRSGRLHSVEGRLRWSWLRRLTLWLVPVFVLYGMLSSLVLPMQGGSGPARDWALLLVIIVATTPLQAAGEEYLFRGFLGRIVGAWLRSGRVALVVSTVLSSLVFMFAHGSTDPWLLGYYLVFGAAMALVAWRTGGLEAPIAVHAVNNVILLVIAVLLTDTAGAFNRTAGVGGPFMLLPMVAISLAGLLTVVLAGRRRVSRRTTS
ncbi:MAG: CPBP family intramembrane metalloprotease [Pseudonocardia sp.]|nr:CPBP family intramembrane metalloprotease [Pseudonocardia sp.]